MSQTYDSIRINQLLVFCRKMATRVPDMFLQLLFTEHSQNCQNSATAEAQEKISTATESLGKIEIA
jgi:hypothetical protein